MTSILFFFLFIMLALNLPVFMALIVSTATVLTCFTSITPGIILQRMFAGIDKFSLMAVPFFIFAANVMNQGGLAPRILDFTNALVGHKRGGLAYTVVLTCMFLGAVSGSSPATVVAICSLMLPVMEQSGYSRGFSVGLIMAASSVAVIIPPSIGMIVYGTVTGTSIGELFLAGFFPGIIYGTAFMLYSAYYTRKHNVPLRPQATSEHRWNSFKSSGWALIIPILIIGSIYGGFCTPTESAGIVSVYAIFVSCFIYRELSFKELVNVAYESAIGTAQVMIILAGASVFSWLLTRLQIPATLAKVLNSVAQSQIMVLLVINIILLISGMFLDPASIQTIMSPLFLPSAVQFGVHPVHLGIIMVVNGAIGMFTPPFGLNLFVAAGVTKISLSELMKDVWIWILISFIALFLITYIPQISMVLPDLLFKK
ncbi:MULTISPECIES: TRAP transporter large permease [Jonquetella]|uniref:TRAP transporter, DctM subunit n=1 Tax=Jonquetella anthropi DSM 22815 TaxID=885272 RepID=H0UJ44_9BACT|nr:MULTISPECIES: TRAP transporter large permease [Jonquetella]EHM13871.1 TRAP transporter, DctM subunit [Jonquetella anthropi DSM 22815]ERL24204.1 TRAP transporter, DctM subunit [Jonquetella sp. BV3C21]